LSEAATNVLESATDIAARLHHGYVGTEHILLALLDSATPGRLARKLRLDVAETEQRLVKAANAAATRQP
jgi:ATP-dependent Clp protease ATP-binding subunit ClpA